MKKRWKVAISAGGLVAALVLVPILYIETACRGPSPGVRPDASYHALLAAGPGRRKEARTWLTYPEWHIVYSAESFGRFLDRRPPSAFPYFRHVGGFWSSFCALNQVTSASPGTTEAKLMIYTIGVSYTVELAVKAIYENTLGRLFEWIGGWRSADDLYAARVQQRYGAFMHETPWYEFPFGDALRGLWRTSEPDHHARHWERRFALSAEYGVKAGYAALLGAGSNATLGPDERTMRIVVRGDAAALQEIDPRFRPVGRVGEAIVVEVPRYAQFTELVSKLAASPISLLEVAGNDDLFVSFLAPSRGAPLGGKTILAMPLDDRPGWTRQGVSLKASELLPAIRRARAAGTELEHVYDY